MITLLLGWDGLGLVRFILVIYYQNPKSLGAGIITALTNRIGDVILLLSIGWALNQNHWSYTSIWSTPFDQALIIAIIIAAITKRAQMPFSRWLPAAIAAPTPVSALVHSSTLVTAGVFLLVRFYYFISRLPWFQETLLIIACLTMFMAGASAITECDLKKIIALSTLSQLGVIMASLGLGLVDLTLFHLLTHALFKALLFVCAGNLIHLHHHSQDLRTIGNLSSQMPLTISCLFIANMALCGSPFLAGFYSKDLILELSLFNPTNIIAIAIFLAATGITAAYSLRLSLSALWAPINRQPLHPVSDSDPDISFPILLLTLGAISAGALINWVFLPPSLDPILPSHLKLAPLIVTFIGALLTWPLFSRNSSAPSAFTSLPITHEASANMWFLVPLSTQIPLKLGLPAAHTFLKTLDQGWNEMAGPQGFYSSFIHLSSTAQPAQGLSINTHLNLAAFVLIPVIILSFI